MVGDIEMVGDYNTTIDSLTHLIDALSSRRNFYEEMLIDNLQPACDVKELLQEKEEFFKKLSVEYKRLTSSEYINSLSSSDNMFIGHKSDISFECLESEENLIELYSEVLNKDIMWEVLPVLANHRSHLIASVDHIKSNLAINKDANIYNDDPLLVN